MYTLHNNSKKYTSATTFLQMSSDRMTKWVGTLFLFASWHFQHGAYSMKTNSCKYHVYDVITTNKAASTYLPCSPVYRLKLHTIFMSMHIHSPWETIYKQMTMKTFLLCGDNLNLVDVVLEACTVVMLYFYLQPTAFMCWTPSCNPNDSIESTEGK